MRVRTPGRGSFRQAPVGLLTLVGFLTLVGLLSLIGASAPFVSSGSAKGLGSSERSLLAEETTAEKTTAERTTAEKSSTKTPASKASEPQDSTARPPAPTEVHAIDFTVFIISDPHLGAENLKAQPPVTRAETLLRAKSNLESMVGLVGRPYPDRPSFESMALGTVAVPRGFFILGDLTDGHKEPERAKEQWDAFEQLFPLEGIRFGDLRGPIFAIAGNHDGDPSGPQRKGLVKRNRVLQEAGLVTTVSPNGVHLAINWEGVHFICLGLCPADGTDSETPFKYGKPGPGSWNDPEGALAFLRNYLHRELRDAGDPVVLLHHYGFDGFSVNDWNWWTVRQRRALHELIAGYNIVAIFHGHDHHAARYRWPDPKLHAADVAAILEGKPRDDLRQYDVLSCGTVGWVVRVRGDRFSAVHYRGPDWTEDPACSFSKRLRP